MAQGSIRNGAGAKDIIANAFDHIVFDHGNMLVGCRMEYNVRLNSCKKRLDCVFIPHVAKQAAEYQRPSVRTECLIYPVKVVFAAIQHYQQAWMLPFIQI